MVTKTYPLWNNQSTLFNAEKKVTVDYFSTVLSASLTWSSGQPFSNIVFNGKVISTNQSGSANVQVVSGGVNTVRVNYPTLSVGTPVVTASLSVDGYLATYDVVRAQNQGFADAFRSGVISEETYRGQIDFQTGVASAMLENGAISQTQYNQLAKILTDALPQAPTPQPNTGGGDGGGGDAHGGDTSGFLGSITSWFSGGSGGTGSSRNMVIGGVFVFVLLLIIVLVLGKKGDAQ